MLHTLAIVAVLCSPQRVSSYGEGLQVATLAEQPLIVLAHGSDWCVRGERFKRVVWDTAADLNNVVFVALDICETPLEAHAAELKGFDANQVRNFPSLLAFAPDGTRLGVRSGATLPIAVAEAKAALRTLVVQSQQRLQLEREVDAAAAAGDDAAELAALRAMLAQDLQRPAHLLDRLAELDPEDASGIRRRAAFGPFHQFVTQAVQDGKEGRGQEAINRLQGMLDEGVYTSEQQAWIHNAMGSAYRYWDGHDLQARGAFRRAYGVAPESVPGLAGKRLAEELYGSPTLAEGWMDRHLKDRLSTWVIEDLDAPMQPGTWTVTFEYTRGRHGLDIAAVQLLDGSKLVARDKHDGFTGHHPSNNRYTMRVATTVANPILHVTAKGAGGQNGWGRIKLKRVSN